MGIHTFCYSMDYIKIETQIIINFIHYKNNTYIFEEYE